MTTSMVKGANLELTRSDGQACGLVLVGVTWQNPAADIDLCAIFCDDSGAVVSDEHFLFWGHQLSPKSEAMLRSVAVGAVPHVVDRAQLVIDLGRIDPRVHRIVFSISTLVPGQSLAAARASGLRLIDLEADNADVICTYINHAGYQNEQCVVIAELYRRNGGWRLRLIDQGYSEGLAALARQHNVNVQ